jgi:hypothetical protein
MSYAYVHMGMYYYYANKSRAYFVQSKKYLSLKVYWNCIWSLYDVKTRIPKELLPKQGLH